MVVLTKLKHPKSQFKPPLKDQSCCAPSKHTDSKTTSTSTHLKQQTLNFPKSSSSLERHSPESSYSSETSSPSDHDDEIPDKKSSIQHATKQPQHATTKQPLSARTNSSTITPKRKPFKTPFKTPFKDNLKPTTTISSSTSTSINNKKSTNTKQQLDPTRKTSKPPLLKESIIDDDEEESDSIESVFSSESNDASSPSEEEEPERKDSRRTLRKPNTTPQKKPLLLLKKTSSNPKTDIVNTKIVEKVAESGLLKTREVPTIFENLTKTKVSSQEKQVDSENNTHENLVETQSKVETAQSSSLSLSLENELEKQTQNKTTSQISVDKPKDTTTDLFIVEISDSSMSPILKDFSKPKKKKNITFKAIESPPTQIEIADSILYEELLPPKKTPQEEEPKWKLKKKQEPKEEHIPKQIKISKFFKKEPIDESNVKPLSSVNRSVNFAKKRKEKSTPIQSSPSVITPVSQTKSPEMKKIKPAAETDSMKTDTPEKIEQPTPKLYAMEFSPETSIFSILDSEDSQCSPPVIIPKKKQEILEEVDESSRESLLPWSQSSHLEDSQMITFSPVHNLKSHETQIDVTSSAKKKSSMSLSPLIDIIGSNNSQQVIMLDLDETQIPDTPTYKINLSESGTRKTKIKEEIEEFDEESTSVDFSEKVSITPPLTTKKEHVGFLTLPYSIDLGGTIQDTEMPTLTHNVFTSENQTANRVVQSKKPIKAKAFGRRQKVSFRQAFQEPAEEEIKPKSNVEESVMNIIASHIESQNQTKSDSSNSFGDFNNDVLRTPPSFSSPELSL